VVRVRPPERHWQKRKNPRKDGRATWPLKWLPDSTSAPVVVCPFAYVMFISAWCDTAAGRVVGGVGGGPIGSGQKKEEENVRGGGCEGKI